VTLANTDISGLGTMATATAADYSTTSAANLLYYPLSSNPAGYLTTAPVTSVAGRTGAITLAVGDVSNAVSLDGTQTISGSKTFTNAGLTFGNSTGGSTINVASGATVTGEIKILNLGTSGLTGSVNEITIGPSAGLSTITVGNTTAVSTLNLAAGATLSGSTKIVNIGTLGAAGSTTNIVIGSTTGTSTTTLRGTTNGATAAADTNTTALATTAYVVGQAGSATPLVDGTAAVGTSLRYARQDHVHGTDTTRAALSGATFTGEVVTPASTTGTAGLMITPGVAPSAPVNGEIWATTTDLQVRLNGVTETVAEQSWVAAQGFLTSAPVISVAGRTGAITLAVADVSGAAPLASPSLTGTPTAPTATLGTNTTQIATTAFVAAAIPTNSVKAWVNFNGTGTVAIRASLNVSSITDNGVGDYTVNMTNAMPDTSYAVFASAAPGSNNQWRVPVTHAKSSPDYTQAPTTTTFRLIWSLNSGTVPDVDMPICQIAVIR
jgi:hypothetical protein